MQFYPFHFKCKESSARVGGLKCEHLGTHSTIVYTCNSMVSAHMTGFLLSHYIR